MHQRQLCLKCLRSKIACFCGSIHAFKTNTRFVILMHPKEFKKEKVGTGRLSHLCLKNSEIIVGESFDDHPKVNHYTKTKICAVLYPGENAVNISKDRLEVNEELVLFVIDGTWPCAKKMMKLSPNLQTLPRVSFDNTKRSRFVIKQQPADYCLSTIESIYLVICELQAQQLEVSGDKPQELLKTLDKLVQYQIDCANDPNKKNYRRSGKYKNPSQRAPSKKWNDRSILFKSNKTAP